MSGTVIEVMRKQERYGGEKETGGVGSEGKQAGIELRRKQERYGGEKEAGEVGNEEESSRHRGEEEAGAVCR